MCAALQPGNFSAGVVIRGTIQEPGAILGVGITGTVFYTLYCYRQHSSAQDFRVCIVIERTVCEKCCCYLQHSLPGQAAGFLQNLLLSSAQFGKIHGLFRVVIGGTFLLPGQNQGCYVRHISKNSAGFSPVVICSTFSGWGLLFSAQFTVCIISFFAATGVVIHGTFCKKSLFSVPFPLLFTAQFPQKFLLGLLFSAQFRKNSAFAGQIVSLDTISRIFAGGCYSRHNLIF